ncbi:hypothetical protein IGI04_023438 [Brassica rapa subsp. trilocularis]|uniref:Copine C-terminal domain-containing protein n=1 Tax=Brassica rapa subsp. trilocularis TaxID=1813537 RepID=A0ABQ7M6F8_BRACM|nr:hypothetical protein IGI04_023438 [Brassica rapa subsp. trilocularis]
MNVKVTRGVDKAEGELSQQEIYVNASSYALSIALIGVGDGRWEDMRKFDDKIPKREFDNFKFVNFTEIMKRDSSESAKEAAFALAALMEIPFQKVVREEEKEVLLLDSDSGGSYTMEIMLLSMKLKKHLITASYVDDETSMLHEMAKNAWITVLGETTSHNSVNLTWPLV